MSISPSLMPHAVCWSADPKLIWTMVVTNLITFLSYLTIALTLLLLVRRTRRIIVHDWAYFVVGFALFILACGTTHLLEVVTTWKPLFWVDAWTNIVTAVLSAWVAVMLIQRITDISFGINDYATRLADSESEKQRLEASLLSARKLEDWSRMSASISHEIKSPLQAIQNLQFLIGMQEGVTPQIAELARMAGEEAQRVLAISNSTLSFFRQGAAPEPIDLRDAAESVRFLLAPLIRQKSITLEIESQGDCTVEAFSGETRQVLLNVIRNACEASAQPGAHVRVELTGNDAGVAITVTDHGAGIDPAILPNLFEFGVSTKGSQGNGMGLWTVKHIVGKHHGKVSVESHRGQGTRIHLWWPRSWDASPLTANATA